MIEPKQMSAAELSAFRRTSEQPDYRLTMLLAHIAYLEAKPQWSREVPREEGFYLLLPDQHYTPLLRYYDSEMDLSKQPKGLWLCIPPPPNDLRGM